MTSLCSRQLSSTTTTTVIVVTDGDTDALALLRENIRRNQGSSHTKSKNNASQSIISCHQLLWGRDTSEHFLQRHCDGKTFDIIIASDIIYAKCIIDPLWETIQTLLSPEGIFILAFAKRRVPIQIDFVLQSAEDAGFTFEAIQEDVEGIFVYEFRRKAW
jgi:predicted nicotinamide N-methyase